MKILCKNMTQAMKANKVLYKYGIYSKVEKGTENKKQNGCVYAISFKDEKFDDAIEILCSENILFHKTQQDYCGKENNY